MTLGNRTHVFLMLAMMAALLGLIGWILGGRQGVMITVGFGVLFSIFGRGASKDWMLMAVGAIRLKPADAPGLFAIVDELAHRAGLAKAPDIYFLESKIMAGFSVGSGRHNAAIVLTSPLVLGLSAREIACVLAHEISHIRVGDLTVMGMADLLTRMTRTLSFLGLFLVILNIPLEVGGEQYVPWTVLLLLVSAPMINYLLQMGLSRSREFFADEGAVDLCGDAKALADALNKMEIQQMNLLRAMFLPHDPGMEPSLLRSHPVTQERIARILSQTPTMPPLAPELVGEHHGFPPGWDGNFKMPVRWLLRWWR